MGVEVIPVRAALLVKALNAEGLDFYVSYMKPLYLQPLYQQQTGYGDKGCPFSCPFYRGKVNYERGICPRAEDLENMVISTEIVRPPQTFADMEEIARGLLKVLAAQDDLQKYATAEGT